MAKAEFEIVFYTCGADFIIDVPEDATQVEAHKLAEDYADEHYDELVDMASYSLKHEFPDFAVQMVRRRVTC